MPEYRVTSTRRNLDDDITHLAGDWGEVDAKTARHRLRSGLDHYTVQLPDGTVAEVCLLTGRTADFLFANWDGTQRNNLDDLPTRI